MYMRGLGQSAADIAAGAGNNPVACLGLSYLSNPFCWSQLPYTWSQQLAVQPGTAPPSVPSVLPTGQNALTTPPASGADAAQVVQDLVNQQMVAQQQVNAAQVVPITDIYSVASDASGVVSSAAVAINWTEVALIVGGVLALILVLPMMVRR